jgi:hypothetical protein
MGWKEGTAKLPHRASTSRDNRLGESGSPNDQTGIVDLWDHSPCNCRIRLQLGLAPWLQSQNGWLVRFGRKPDAPVTTRLTQNSKRQAKGSPPKLPYKKMPFQQNVCVVCGQPIESCHRFCAECAVKNSTASLIAGARLGRVAAQSSRAKARRNETKRRNDMAQSNWHPSDQPAWLTDEVYSKQIQPRLNKPTLSQIASAIGVSIPYASDIRKGRRRPHPRHWKALANLVGATG